MMSPDEVLAEIMRVSQQLDWQVGEAARRARVAAECEVAYKLAFAKALLVSDGKNAPERDAKALLACADKFEAHKHADAVLWGAQEAGRTLRTQIDALRTLSADLRAAIVHASGVGG